MTERLVERGQFAGQHAQRPAVGNDVMHGQQQDVTVFSQTQQTATDRQVALQVEGLRGLFPDHGLQGLRVLITQILPTDARQFSHRRCLYPGNVVFLTEAAAQAVVAGHDAFQCTRQGTAVQWTGQFQAQRDVVGTIGIFHLRHEPDALLSGRQGYRAVAWLYVDDRQLTARGSAQAVCDRDQRTVGKQVAKGQFQ